MLKLNVPATVLPQFGGDYLWLLGWLLCALFGGNIVERHDGVYYDNASCDAEDPENEAALYADLLARAERY